MTPEHIIFIPTIFLMGALAGALITARRAPALPVLLTMGIALSVFALTHLTPFPFGPAALRDVTGGQPLFDQSPSFSAQAVLDRLDALGADGRALYQQMTFTGDLVFPLSLLAFFFALARLAARHPLSGASLARPLLVLPFAWFGLDMIENALIFSLIAGFPDSSPILANLLGPVTALKLILLPASVAAPLLVLGLFRLRGRQTRAGNAPAATT